MREVRGWTQAELGERADVPAMMISHYETGVRSNPSLVTLRNLAQQLKVSMEWLDGRADNPTPIAGPLAALFRSVTEQGSGEKLEIVEAFLKSMTSDASNPKKKK